MREDATSKKFLVSEFNSYVMSDSRSVMEQFHELERILGNFRQYNMYMDETIVVSSIIDKLSLSWKDFKHSLKHKKEDLSIEDLAKSLRVEEEFRRQEESKNRVVHVVETGQVSNNKRKGNFTPLHNDKQRKIVCWNCGSPQLKRECTGRRDDQVAQGLV